MESMGIYDIVGAIHKDLVKLGQDKEIQDSALMVMSQMQVELSVVVSKAGKGNLEFVLVTGGTEYSQEKINKVKLTFEPLAKCTTFLKAEDQRARPVLASPSVECHTKD